MLRTRYVVCCSIILGILLISSCDLVTWEKLDLYCNVEESQTHFNGENIQLFFSSDPVQQKTERYVQLKADGESVAIYTHWQEKRLFISPEKGWRKGKEYELVFSGSVEMVDGRIYSKSLTRHFTYGEPGQRLKIIDYSIANDSTVRNDTPLVFEFSKVVSVTSFDENFKLNPHIETDIVFLEANTKVRVQPKNDWGINKIYKWTISELLSADEYRLDKEYTGQFYSPLDTTQPELLTICPVEQTSTGFVWQEDRKLDGNVYEQDSIGFIFSKPMDFDSVESGITFSPSVKGYFKAVENDATRFVFYPEENYEIQTKYAINVSEQISDINDIALFTEHIEYFTTGNSYITVTSIQFGSEPLITDYTDTPFDYALSDSGLMKQLVLKVNFSTPIDKTYQMAAADSVGISPFFPSTVSSPSLQKISWNVEKTTITMLWEGFTPTTLGSDNYYKILIQSGANGVMNAQGEYIEEDVCVYFRAL